MTERIPMLQAIAALEAQRTVLGDAVVDASIAALRKQLAELDPAPLDEQRKLVTVLFADLAGWTAMSERLDAEDVRGIQQAYFAAVTPPILQRGGRVEKYIGDAILAVFGVPRAEETDPENAVRAALAMQQAISDLNHRLAESSPPTFPFRSGSGLRLGLISDLLTSDVPTLSLRIGVHTGPVLATVGQRADDFVVTGDTVNLAARLQSAAPPGGAMISHDTWRHVADLFEVEPQEPLTLKGKAERVRSYLVLRAHPRPFRRSLRGVAGVKTRMVGRKTELGLLQDALITVMEDRQAQMVTVVGEAGVGKSRLLYEFEVWADLLPQDVFYFKGRATPETQHTPYGILRDLIATRFQIEDDDGLPEVRQKLEAGFLLLGQTGDGSVASLDLKETHLIGQLLGYDFGDSPHVKPLLDDPLRLRTQALAALEAYFRSLSQHDPLVVVLEDMHWADDSSLDACGHLLSKLEQMPLLVLCAGRSSLYQRRPHWGEGLTYHRRLDLQPLSKRAVGQLLEEILQRVGEVPAKLRELVVAGADGNPFYVEELVKMLIEDGVIIADADGRSPWGIETERLATVHVPPSLTSLLQARVDRLPSEERKALQQASVVGRLFWDRAVAHIQQNSGEESHDISDTLSALRAREMVFRREATAFTDSQEYLFKHALLRDVAYESVLKRLRRVYHGLVADWLIEQAGERISEFVGIIADHLEGAGRSDEAVNYLVRAGDQARLVYAHQEAVNRYERALVLLEETGAYEQAARTCMRLGLTHQNASDYARARQAYDQGFALWQRTVEGGEAIELPPAPHAYRIARREPRTLDPTRTDDTWMIGQLFSGLVEPGPNFEVTPDVAKSWHVSGDGRTYVFHLRDDVSWSDGTPVTAGDFEYAWKRTLRPETDARLASLWYDIKNARAYHRSELSDAERLGVRAADDRSLVVELEQPVGYFLQLLATSFYPMPRHVVERCGESWTNTENIVTNGPFLLRAWQPGKSLILVRNPYYHGRFRGNVAQLEVNLLTNWPTRLAMYEANELDSLGIGSSITGLYADGPFDPVRARQRHADESVALPGWYCAYLAMNLGEQPFNDLRVRRALALASNREALVDTVFRGENIPATGGFLPPEMPGHSRNIALPYDPAQARQLFVESGYPNGRGFPAIEAAVSGFAAPLIDFLVQQWRDNLGIEVTAVVRDSRSFKEMLGSSPPPMLITDWVADYPDPDNFLRVGLTLTRRWWQNETFERLIRQVKQLTDQRVRIQIYQQADRMLVQEAVIIPLTYRQGHWLKKPWLTGLSRDGATLTRDIIIRPH